jgi:hypothetical protein
MHTAIPMAPTKPPDTSPKETSKDTPSKGTSSEGALFDFDDLQALRDEYEERIARLEREKTATVDVLKRDNESRFTTMQRDYESRLQNEATSRQELIHELTFELAAAREDGERRAQEADKRRLVVEQQLHSALTEISRVEGDVQRLKEGLMKALDVKPAPAVAPLAPVTSSPPAPAHSAPAYSAPAYGAPAYASPTPSATSRPTPPPMPPEEGGMSASLAAFAPGKKKKIRLR